MPKAEIERWVELANRLARSVCHRSPWALRGPRSRRVANVPFVALCVPLWNAANQACRRAICKIFSISCSPHNGVLKMQTYRQHRQRAAVSGERTVGRDWRRGSDWGVGRRVERLADGQMYEGGWCCLLVGTPGQQQGVSCKLGGGAAVPASLCFSRLSSPTPTCYICTYSYVLTRWPRGGGRGDGGEPLAGLHDQRRIQCGQGWPLVTTVQQVVT